MIPMHLYDAILVHFTVEELHDCRSLYPDFQCSAERQLQLRFPKLTLSYILTNTDNGPADFSEYNTRLWSLRSWYRGISHRVLPKQQCIQLCSVQHDCQLEYLRADFMRVYVNTADDDFLLCVMDVDSKFYIRIWDFYTEIQTHTISISKPIYCTMHVLRPVNLLVSPNRRAVFFTDHVSINLVVYYTGNIVEISMQSSVDVVWKEKQLYADNQLIYTLV